LGQKTVGPRGRGSELYKVGSVRILGKGDWELTKEKEVKEHRQTEPKGGNKGFLKQQVKPATWRSSRGKSKRSKQGQPVRWRARPKEKRQPFKWGGGALENSLPIELLNTGKCKQGGTMRRERPANRAGKDFQLKRGVGAASKKTRNAFSKRGGKERGTKK